MTEQHEAQLSPKDWRFLLEHGGMRETFSVLQAMQHLGSSVMLAWDEESGEWECSWITSGRRYTAFAPSYVNAILRCRDRAVAAIQKAEA